jgi:endonuclease-3
MARTTRAATTAASQGSKKNATPPSKKVSRASVKKEEPKTDIKQEESTPQKTKRGSKRAAASDPPRQSKRVKSEDDKSGLLSPSETDSKSFSLSPEPDKKASTTPKAKKSDPQDLSAKKVKAYFAHANKSPFPDFPHPTAEEAKLAHRILTSLHGARVRPEKVIASKDSAGCGDSPSVLDALVRTILSQNTSDKNSTRAKKSMDKVYGGSDNWEEIVKGGQPKLQEAIKSGGLALNKSKAIITILQQAKEKYGVYSLDHLFDASNEDAMREMLSFQGVGPKTASCVLLFCLQRESFAVDTHVHRITGLLGWRPKNADREQAHSHLDVMIPDEDKYGLHILLVNHGKVCDECKAGGKNTGKCELRKAFRQGKIKGEAGDEVKEEEVEKVKEEKVEDEDEDEDDSD